MRVWDEQVEIPTYGTGKPDKNPMFLEKRVYQGVPDESTRIRSSIKSWMRKNPTPIAWSFLKTNTFASKHTATENEDGSATVWVSEIDRMYGTKLTTGFTLHPGKAYIEVMAQMYNRTSEPQTFLWWANPAMAVNDQTQTVFPPDVTAVFDHGKRDVSKFPIATGTYYKMDYSEGVDISRYKNIPVPTSYMAYKSDYNFVGGYDHGVQAGLLHVANHHVSPGKKQWTWGNGEFGQAWDRSLTDEDGPYIELMTGVFTDNQPDFTWLQPYEEKAFTQYFMRTKTLESSKNGSRPT